MMETIRIRRAGYPIRHKFAEFVDRYRILVSGIGPSHVEECRSASAKIGKAVLGNADYQLGKTKVFLKVRLSFSRDIQCRDVIDVHHIDESSFQIFNNRIDKHIDTLTKQSWGEKNGIALCCQATN